MAFKGQGGQLYTSEAAMKAGDTRYTAAKTRKQGMVEAGTWGQGAAAPAIKSKAVAKKTTTNVAPKATDGAIMSYAKPYSELPASMKMSPIPASMQKSPIPAAKPQVKKESFFKKTFVTNPMETQKFINKSVKKFVTPPKRESEGDWGKIKGAVKTAKSWMKYGI